MNKATYQVLLEPLIYELCKASRVMNDVVHIPSVWGAVQDTDFPSPYF